MTSCLEFLHFDYKKVNWLIGVNCEFLSVDIKEENRPLAIISPKYPVAKWTALFLVKEEADWI